MSEIEAEIDELFTSQSEISPWMVKDVVVEPLRSWRGERVHERIALLPSFKHVAEATLVRERLKYDCKEYPVKQLPKFSTFEEYFEFAMEKGGIV